MAEIPWFIHSYFLQVDFHGKKTQGMFLSSRPPWSPSLDVFLGFVCREGMEGARSRVFFWSKPYRLGGARGMGF